MRPCVSFAVGASITRMKNRHCFALTWGSPLWSFLLSRGLFLDPALLLVLTVWTAVEQYLAAAFTTKLVHTVYSWAIGNKKM